MVSHHSQSFALDVSIDVCFTFPSYLTTNALQLLFSGSGLILFWNANMQVFVVYLQVRYKNHLGLKDGYHKKWCDHCHLSQYNALLKSFIQNPTIISLFPKPRTIFYSRPKAFVSTFYKNFLELVSWQIVTHIRPLKQIIYWHYPCKI